MDITLDFIKVLEYHQRQKYSVHKDPLAKALGLSKIKNPIIWDLTCGLGEDALLMLHFGAQVISFERNPIIFSKLLDAFNVALKNLKWKDLLIEKWKIINLDSKLLNSNSFPTSNIDIPTPQIIYLDPMYPGHEKRKTKPKKEMLFLRNIVGDDQDASELFLWATTLGPKRIVVKRPNKAPLIVNTHKPTHQYVNKSIRFDMYSLVSK